jgi:alkanesulfonate monooxygenase SsuD/methylene tetrahydromethanopterin reductase-like flavin-dependent oxidoreductase (luciferase family)
MTIKFGCDLTTYGDVDKTIKYALLAEKCGFHAVTLPDHLFNPLTKRIFQEPPWEVFTLLAAIGIQTRRVMLAPAVADTVRRHPALIAHTVATLDHITKGRIALGIGCGEAFNIMPLKDIAWDKPFTRLKEAVTLIKSLWNSTFENPITFLGEYFKVEQAYLSFKPLQKPHPPIYIGGFGPKIRMLVGQLADGWLPWIYSPETYREDLKEIENSAKRAGRSMDEIDTGVQIHTVVLKNGDEAKKIATSRNLAALALRSSLLRDMGYPELAEQALSVWKLSFSEEELNKQSKLINSIPPEVNEKTLIAGTPDEAIEQIEKFIQAGVKFLDVMPIIEKFEETVQVYKKEIIPYFIEQYNK